MSGHSKWANIKHRKGKQDAIRGRQFTKVAREIMAAARQGGGDPEGNSRLRLAIQNARSINMPKDRITKAISKGSGADGAGENWEQVTYEGYGPRGVAVLAECLTDNRNRTTAEVRHVFSKAGGNLGETGCVGYLFNPRGQVIIGGAGLDEEKAMELAMESGADDLEQLGEEYVLDVEFSSLHQVVKTLEGLEIEVKEAKRVQVPSTSVSVDVKSARKILAFLDKVEELDDVQQVWANLEIPDEDLDAVMGD